MVFELSDHMPGRIRTPEQLATIQACQDVFIAFCDLMDEGKVEEAAELHLDGVVLYDVGRDAPLVGKANFLERMLKVRFSYPGRRTLHTPTNFRFHKVGPDEAECRVVIALVDLFENPGKRGIGRFSTEFMGYAAEEVRFVPEEGRWLFHTRKVRFLAGARRLPIGTLPGDLPWSE